MTELACPLLTAAREYRDHPALIDSGQQLSWGQTDSLVTRAAFWLSSQGVRPGDRVALRVSNRIDSIIVLWAIGRVGAVAVLLNHRYPRATLTAQIAQVKTDYVVAIPGDKAVLIDKATPTITFGGLENLPEATDDAMTGMTWTMPQDHPLTIMFTSGSSAEPKAVRHSLGNHYYSAAGSNDNLNVGPQDRWLLTLPLYHVGGLGILWRCLLGGGAIVIPDDRADMATQIERDQITHLSLVPTQLQRLLEPKEPMPDTACLNAVLLGGAKLSAGLISRASKAGLPVYATYGLTEMCSQVATSTVAGEFTLAVLNHRQVKISDEGEIMVRGATLFLGYVQGDQCERPVNAEGWFGTGDLGRLDEAGGLEVTGRKDNLFISGGENIQPEQIEAALLDIDGLEMAVVVPIADDEYGHRPVAFIRLRPELSLSDYETDLPEETRFQYDHLSLLARLEKALPHFMLPTTFYPWPHSYIEPGLKVDRVFFRNLAAKLRHPTA